MTDHLRTITIDGTASGPHLLVTAGVHGDEFTPIAAVRQLAQTITSDQLTGRLTLVPIVNRAAFLRGNRTAEDGLDLARVCPGNPKGSVTERTAAAVSELIRSADAYIDLHTGSTDISVMPLTGYMLHHNGDVLARQRQMARAFNLPVVWGTSANLEGRTLSVARDAGIPAIYVEYLGSGLLSDQGVAALSDGCRNVMALLDMLDHPRPAPRWNTSLRTTVPVPDTCRSRTPPPPPDSSNRPLNWGNGCVPATCSAASPTSTTTVSPRSVQRRKASSSSCERSLSSTRVTAPQSSSNSPGIPLPDDKDETAPS